MAENSLREQIIASNIAIVTNVTGIKTVKRTMPKYSELENFAQTVFPLAAVVGRIPVPESHKEGRSGSKETFISDFKIDIFTYILQRVDPDQMISDLLDEYWKDLYEDQLRGKLVIATELIPTEKVNVWEPYAAFQLTINHKYVHTTGGI